MLRRLRLMRFAFWQHRRCWLRIYQNVMECLDGHPGQAISMETGLPAAGSLPAKAQEDGESPG